MDPKYLAMCPLPNCSVCEAIRLENRVKAETASEQIDILSVYSSICPKVLCEKTISRRPPFKLARIFGS